MSKPIIAIDFDGVLHDHKHSAWAGAAVVEGPPIPGAMAALVELVDHFSVHIFSSRSSSPEGRRAMQYCIAGWLVSHLNEDRDFPFDEALRQGRVVAQQLTYPEHKPPALISIDDRAVTFDGDWQNFTAEKLKAFRPWNA